MLPQHNEIEKGFGSTETIEEKIENQVLHPEREWQNNACMDICEENHSNQRNSQEIESLRGSWTYQQQIQLYKLHDQLGNKWSMIAEYFQNKNDNSVKNHFYSRLRKSLRRLNRIICVVMKKSIKEIKNNVIYKIIEVTEQRHKIQNQDAISVEITELCRELKSRLLKFSYDQTETNQQQSDFYSVGKQLVEDLVSFNRQYRRKAKKTNTEVKEVKIVQKNKISKIYKQFNVMSVSECSLFESLSSQSQQNKANQHKIITRRRAKSDEYEPLKQQVSGTFTPTNLTTQNLFKDQFQVFFKQSGILQNNLICLPEMRKVQSNDLHIGIQKMMQDIPQFQFFEQHEESHQKIDNQDHFSDPCLNQGDFSLFK